MTSRLTDDTGATIALGDRLGAGGEGEVFSLHDTPTHVAKRLFPPRRRREKYDKIQTMVARPPPGAHELVEGYPVLAWPQRILYEDHGRRDHGTFAGYTMRRVSVQRDFIPLYQIMSHARRKNLGAAIAWDRLVLVGLRICHVVRTLHRMDYAIGDLNDRNILLSRRFTPLFLDTDSFQVPRQGRGHHPCAVADRLYWPPELLRVDLTTYQGSRIPTDRYALAVLLFQLFLNGMRPYQARGSRVDGLESLEAKTEAGLYPWAHPKKGVLEPPMGAPDYQSLPAPMRRAFEAAFVDGHRNPKKRPTADDWYHLLKRIHDEGYQTCTEKPQHRYGAREKHCPWCRDANDPFTDHARVPAPRRARPPAPRRAPPRPAPRPARAPKPPSRRQSRKTTAQRRVANRARPAPAAKAPPTRRRSSAPAWIGVGIWNSGVAVSYFSPVFFFAKGLLTTSALAYLAIVATLVPALAASLVQKSKGTLRLAFFYLLAGVAISVLLAWQLGWIALAIVAGIGHLLIGFHLYRSLEANRPTKYRADTYGIMHAGAGLLAAYLPLCAYWVLAP